MEEWRVGTVTGDLNEVPGIGPAAVKKLADGGVDETVTNTYQLFGKFLMLKGPDSVEHQVESFEHMEKFWHWLANKEISSHRSAVVKAIAEKTATFFKDIYDANQYDDEESDDE